MSDEFKRLAAEVFKINPDTLDENSAPGAVPEWDSLSHWLLIGKIELHYSIEFTMDEAVQFKDLGDMYRTVLRKLAQSGS